MYDRVTMARIQRLAAAGLLLSIPLVARAESPRVKADTIRLAGGHYVADLTDGGQAELTLDPRLQASTDDVLRAFQIPYAGAVVVSVPDGRVLALVGRSAADPRLGAEQLALRAWAPSASVFKVVSATALVEHGVSGATRVCYHGGVSAVLPDNLIDVPAIDRRCDTLAYGLGKSQNAIIAKLVTQHLTAGDLAGTARSFAFGQPIPFEIPVEASHLDVPSEPLELARASAGFWHSTLSPLHGALLAATIAAGGQMPAPTVIQRAVDAQGQPEALPMPAPRHVADPAAAAEVGRMMELTTRIGTAKGTFRNKRGQRLLPVEVAGKTGTLSANTDRGPIGYSWFVGYAPADHPRIAFAVVLGNGPAWRIKATYVGRHIVSEVLAGRAGKSGPGLVAAR
jgi:cell division protein FtsI/penicillin-binding protein 2